MDQLFSLCSGFALAGWVLLLILPKWRWTDRLILSGLWSLALSVVYLILVLLFMRRAEGGFGSIAEVRTLFSTDALLLAGWVHYLAFDLLVGAFIVRHARESDIPHLLLVPVLVLTFLLGPAGLVCFFIVRSIRSRRVAEVIP